jgi:signal transduction histidine kinase
LLKKKTKYRVQILDQGKGMPIRLADGHSFDVGSLGVGIMGMKQRLNEIGGTLSIKSGAQGTTVTATVPREVSYHD